MKKIERSILIGATRGDVWRVLSEFEAYSILEPIN